MKRKTRLYYENRIANLLATLGQLREDYTDQGKLVIRYEIELAAVKVELAAIKASMKATPR